MGWGEVMWKMVWGWGAKLATYFTIVAWFIREEWFRSLHATWKSIEGEEDNCCPWLSKVLYLEKKLETKSNEVWENQQQWTVMIYDILGYMKSWYILGYFGLPMLCINAVFLTEQIDYYNLIYAQAMLLLFGDLLGICSKWGGILQDNTRDFDWCHLSN